MERSLLYNFVERISVSSCVCFALEYLRRQLVVLIPGACCQVETPLPYLRSDDFERQKRRNLMSSSEPAQFNNCVEQAPDWLASCIKRVSR